MCIIYLQKAPWPIWPVLCWPTVAKELYPIKKLQELSDAVDHQRDTYRSGLYLALFRYCFVPNDGQLKMLLVRVQVDGC